MRIALWLSILLWIFIIVGINYACAGEEVGGTIIDSTTRMVKPGVQVEIRQCHCGSPSFSKPPVAELTTDYDGAYRVCLERGFVYKIIPIPVEDEVFEPEFEFVDLTVECE